ncbi:asialoglycoprotein receptor 1-like [Erpetoichthys calabaricus]|nr:asialoglycoprotein receptor 1-like [Erpetoichthys calabaricus]
MALEHQPCDIWLKPRRQPLWTLSLHDRAGANLHSQSPDSAPGRPPRCISWALLLILFLDVFLLTTALALLLCLSNEQRIMQKNVSNSIVEVQAMLAKSEAEIFPGLSERLLLQQENISYYRQVLDNMSDFRAERDLQSIIEILPRKHICQQNKNGEVSSCFPCGTNWLAFKENCYYFVLERKDWYSSKEFCANHKATLVVINSEEEQDFITEQHNSEFFWIGLSDTEEEGEFKWEDGTNFTTTTTFWRADQPDNFLDNEDCISRDPNEGTWNDVPCSYNYFFICERTTLLLDDIKMQLTVTHNI